MIFEQVDSMLCFIISMLMPCFDRESYKEAKVRFDAVLSVKISKSVSDLTKFLPMQLTA